MTIGHTTRRLDRVAATLARGLLNQPGMNARALLLSIALLAAPGCKGMGGLGHALGGLGHAASGLGHVASGIGHVASGMAHVAGGVAHVVGHIAAPLARAAPSVLLHSGQAVAEAAAMSRPAVDDAIALAELASGSEVVVDPCRDCPLEEPCGACAGYDGQACAETDGELSRCASNPIPRAESADAGYDNDEP